MDEIKIIQANEATKKDFKVFCLSYGLMAVISTSLYYFARHLYINDRVPSFEEMNKYFMSMTIICISSAIYSFALLVLSTNKIVPIAIATFQSKQFPPQGHYLPWSQKLYKGFSAKALALLLFILPVQFLPNIYAFIFFICKLL